MTDTDKREELVEEATKAMQHVYQEEPPFGGLDWRGYARAALAVFEQAHTPSDDAREALIRRAQGITENMKASAGDRRGDEWCYIRYRDVDALQAVLAALRRTAVQEPSAFRCKHCRHCDAKPVETQGEPTPVRFVARQGGKAQSTIDALLAQANEHGIRVEVVYPQGEPTDAAVIEAVHAIGLRGFHVTASAMRAALRAAYETKGEGR